MSNPHTDKPDECDSCGYETTELTECDAYARTQGHGPFTPDEEKEWAWLCEICQATPAGRHFLYPRNYDSQSHDVLAAISWSTNHLAHLITTHQSGVPT